MEWRAEFQRDFSCMSVHLRVINTAHIYIYPYISRHFEAFVYRLAPLAERIYFDHEAKLFANKLRI